MWMLVNLYLDDSTIHNYIDVITITIYSKTLQIGVLSKESSSIQYGDWIKNHNQLFFSIYETLHNPVHHFYIVSIAFPH